MLSHSPTDSRSLGPPFQQGAVLHPEAKNAAQRSQEESEQTGFAGFPHSVSQSVSIRSCLAAQSHFYMTVHASSVLMQLLPMKRGRLQKSLDSRTCEGLQKSARAHARAAGRCLSCKGTEAPALESPPFLAHACLRLCAYIRAFTYPEEANKHSNINVSPSSLRFLSKVIKPKEEVMRPPNLSQMVRNFGGLDFVLVSEYSAFGIKYYLRVEKRSEQSVLEDPQLVFAAQLLTGLPVGRNAHTYLGIVETICSRLSRTTSPKSRRGDL